MIVIFPPEFWENILLNKCEGGALRRGFEKVPCLSYFYEEGSSDADVVLELARVATDIHRNIMPS
jgi:hypothetical protein